MSDILHASLHPAPASEHFLRLTKALALCFNVLEGTPAHLAQVDRLNTKGDPDFERSGKNRHDETLRVFHDWFGF